MSLNKLLEQLERAEMRQRSGGAKKKRTAKKRTAKKRSSKKRTAKKRTAKKRTAKKRTAKKRSSKKRSSKRVQWRGVAPAKMTIAQRKAWAAAMKRARARKAKR